MDQLPEYDLVVYAGTPFTRAFPVLQDDGIPVPYIAVASGRAQVREQYNRDEVLHEWHVTIEDVDDAAYVRLSATGAETADWVDWPGKTAYWDLEITDGDGNVHALTEIGNIRIRPRITR